MAIGADKSTPANGRPVVLQTLPHLGAGGVAEEAVEIAAALAASGATALTASAGGPRVADIEAAGARHFRLPLHSKNPARMWRNARTLGALAAAEKVDIVHAVSRAPAWSAEAAARRRGCAFVTTFYGTYSHRWRPKRAYNAVMARGDRIIAVSEHIRDYIRSVYSPPDERIRLIPIGVDTARFDPARVAPGRAAALRESWGLAGRGPLIALPGRLTRWKGQAVLIEALARLGDRDFVCALIGDDQGRKRYRAELEALIARCGLGGRVRLAGPCADMPAAYAAADIVVSASIEPEASGKVVVEAQAMARPVIAPDHGGARDTVRDGETGWLVPPGDAEALAAALARALDAPALRAGVGAAARRRMAADFSVGAMCENTLAVYNALMSERR